MGGMQAGNEPPPKLLMTHAGPGAVPDGAASDRSIMSPVGLGSGGFDPAGPAPEISFGGELITAMLSMSGGGSASVDSPLTARVPLAPSGVRSSTAKFPEIDRASPRTSNVVPTSLLFHDHDDSTPAEDCSEAESGRLRVRQKRLQCVEEQGARGGGGVDSDATERPVSLLTAKTDLVLEVSPSTPFNLNRFLLFQGCFCQILRS